MLTEGSLVSSTIKQLSLDVLLTEQDDREPKDMNHQGSLRGLPQSSNRVKRSVM
tara:strand:- start:165 stop:326 length:162 start_codon:yes stop_codon:yes gene_type:complete